MDSEFGVSPKGQKYPTEQYQFPQSAKWEEVGSFECLTSWNHANIWVYFLICKPSNDLQTPANYQLTQLAFETDCQIWGQQCPLSPNSGQWGKTGIFHF